MGIYHNPQPTFVGGTQPLAGDQLPPAVTAVQVDAPVWKRQQIVEILRAWQVVEPHPQRQIYRLAETIAAADLAPYSRQWLATVVEAWQKPGYQAQKSISRLIESAVAGTAELIEGADTASSTGVVAVAGVSTITEAADTSSSEGAVAVVGTSTITEAGDTLASTGTVPSDASTVDRTGRYHGTRRQPDIRDKDHPYWRNRTEAPEATPAPTPKTRQRPPFVDDAHAPPLPASPPRSGADIAKALLGLPIPKLPPPAAAVARADPQIPQPDPQAEFRKREQETIEALLLLELVD